MADLDIDLESQAQVILEVEGDLRFPANVVGGNGIAVTRDGVDYVITNTEGPLAGPVGPQGETGATGATGAAGPITAGAVVASAYAEYTANADLTTQIPIDDTIPQVTEGTQILSAAITPKSTTNKLRIRFKGMGTIATAATNWTAAVFVNGGANAVRAGYVTVDQINYERGLVLEHEFTPASTSTQTITVRVGPATANTLRLNGNPSGRQFGGVMAATLVVEEIMA